MTRPNLARGYGLSPRVRRHLGVATIRELAEGSISACAEAPRTAQASILARWVYLRVCGGTRVVQAFQSALNGLSPRVRRHHPEKLLRSRWTRSISACAEAPPRPPLRSGLEGVYLRVCGGTPTP